MERWYEEEHWSSIAVDFDRELVGYHFYNGQSHQFKVLNMRSFETLASFSYPGLYPGLVFFPACGGGHDVMLSDKLLLLAQSDDDSVTVHVYNWEEQQRKQILTVGDYSRYRTCFERFENKIAVTGETDTTNPHCIKVWTLESDGASFGQEPTFTFRSRDGQPWRALSLDADQVNSMIRGTILKNNITN
jgi:hypothetical protein